MVFVNCVLELVESGRDLESLEENSLLPLNSNIFRPFDKSSQVSFWLNVSSNSEVTSILSEQWALHSLVSALASC